jgi:hypothetical protein
MAHSLRPKKALPGISTANKTISLGVTTLRKIFERKKLTKPESIRLQTSNASPFEFVRLVYRYFGGRPPKRVRTKWNFYVSENPGYPKAGLKALFNGLDSAEIERLEQRVKDDHARLAKETEEYIKKYGHEPIRTKAEKTKALVGSKTLPFIFNE